MSKNYTISNRPPGVSLLDYLVETYGEHWIADSIDDEKGLATIGLLKELKHPESGIHTIQARNLADGIVEIVGYDLKGGEKTITKFDLDVKIVSFQKYTLTQVEKDNNIGEVGEVHYKITLANGKTFFAPIEIYTGELTDTTITEVINGKVFSNVKIDNLESKPTIELKTTENGLYATLRVDNETAHNVELIPENGKGLRAEFRWLDSDELVGFKFMTQDEYVKLSDRKKGVLYFCYDIGKAYLNGYNFSGVLPSDLLKALETERQNQLAVNDLVEKSIGSLEELLKEKELTIKDLQSSLTSIESKIADLSVGKEITMYTISSAADATKYLSGNGKSGTVKLQSNVEVGRLVYGAFAASTTQLDLNSRTLSTADKAPSIYTRGSQRLTIKGSGSIINTVEAVSNNLDYPVFRVEGTSIVDLKGGVFKTNAPQLAPICVNGGTVNIYDGVELQNTNYNVLAFVLKGNLNIYGGVFRCDGGDASYLLNCLDSAYESGSAKITVYGGTFYGFNPGDCISEGQNTSFLADGYKSVDIGDNTWKVIPYDSLAF